MNFLVDHNLKGHAVLLSGTLLNSGWLDWVSLQFVFFEEMELSIQSSDRVVWRLAQWNQMILLTANWSMKGEDSLEQVMGEEIMLTSLPVVTVSHADRLFDDPEYRERCAIRLVEIVLDIEEYRGVSRLFIP